MVAMTQNPSFSANEPAATEAPSAAVAQMPVPYRYFYDCEFIEDGRTIDLVSIGVVDEHGREFYAISTEFDPTPALPWVRRNVLDRLPSPGHPAWRSRQRIRDDLYEFLVEPLRRDEAASGASSTPPGPRRPYEIELWAWYAAYDHVVLAQLWGRMPDLPREIPRFTKDLRQLWDERGRPPLPQSAQRHDALVDARHNLARWRAMQNHRSG
jgi:hypothetical protein